MELIKFSIPTEVRKHLKGKPSETSAASLLNLIGPGYLEMMKAAGEQAAEQKGVDELERLYRLEDLRDSRT